MRILERLAVIAMLKGLAVLASMLHGQVWFFVRVLYWAGFSDAVYICRITLAIAVILGFLFLPGRHSLKVSLLAVTTIAVLIGVHWVLGWPPDPSDMGVDVVYAVIIVGIGSLLRGSEQQPTDIWERPLLTAILTGLTVLLTLLFGGLWVFVGVASQSIPSGMDLSPQRYIVGELYVCRFILANVVALGLLLLPARHALKVSLSAIAVITALIGIERMLLWSPFAGSMIFDMIYAVMILGIGFLLQRPRRQQ